MGACHRLRIHMWTCTHVCVRVHAGPHLAELCIIRAGLILAQ